MNKSLSVLLQTEVFSFKYTGVISDPSPSFVALLGYSESMIAGLSFEDVVKDYEGSVFYKIVSSTEEFTESGFTEDEAVLVDASGTGIRGHLRMEWKRGSRNRFYCFFKTDVMAEVPDVLNAPQKLADMSVSAFFEIDDYFIITFADRGFRFYFDLPEAAAGLSIKDVPLLAPIYTAISGNGLDKSVATVNCAYGELVAVIGRKPSGYAARLYGKEFLLYRRFPYSLPEAQSRKLIWDSVPMAMLVDPEKNRIVEANAAAARFYGYTQAELREMPISNINVLPLDILEQEAEMALSGRKNFFVFRHRTADGNVKDVTENVTPLVLFGKPYLFAFITDITRRKSLEKVIEEKNRTLTELNIGLSRMVKNEVENRKKHEQLFMQQSRLIAMSEMVGAVAHNWRQPLNNIGLLVQDLEDANVYGELNDKYISETVRKVMLHLQTMSKSVENFRNFFRPSKEKNFFDVKEAVASVADLLSAQLKNRKITMCISCEYCEKASEVCDSAKTDSCFSGKLFILGYSNEFKQILLNVITNSIEAIQNCRILGVALDDDEGLVFVTIKREGDYMAVCIDDNGGGMGEGAVSKVFEPYFSTKRNGFGVGLYMAKTFVESNMRGSMTIENIDDGCRVIIKIPHDGRNYEV